MDRDEFLRMMDAEYQTIRKINETKGHDYAGDDDALANFKEQARAVGLAPEQVWAIFAGKHWSAVMTYVREQGQLASEPIEGRLHDLILYSFLMLGLIEERKRARPSPVEQVFARAHQDPDDT